MPLYCSNYVLCTEFDYVAYRVSSLVSHSMICFSVFCCVGGGSGFLGPRADHAREWRYVCYIWL
jgi:hypothetical protein